MKRMLLFLLFHAWLAAQALQLEGDKGVIGNPVTTWTDQSGNSNDASASGDGRPVDGGNYLTFNGIDDFMTVPTLHDLGDTSFTVEAFVYIISSAADQSLVGVYEDVDNYWYLRVRGGDARVEFRVQEAGATYIRSRTGNPTIADSTWYHICFAYDASLVGMNKLNMYFNGVEAGYVYGDYAANTAVTTNDTLTIGNFSGARWLNANLADVRITIGMALSEAQALVRYNALLSQYFSSDEYTQKGYINYWNYINTKEH